MDKKFKSMAVAVAFGTLLLGGSLVATNSTNLTRIQAEANDSEIEKLIKEKIQPESKTITVNSKNVNVRIWAGIYDDKFYAFGEADGDFDDSLLSDKNKYKLYLQGNGSSGLEVTKKEDSKVYFKANPISKSSPSNNFYVSFNRDKVVNVNYGDYSKYDVTPPKDKAKGITLINKDEKSTGIYKFETEVSTKSKSDPNIQADFTLSVTKNDDGTRKAILSGKFHDGYKRATYGRQVGGQQLGRTIIPSITIELNGKTIPAKFEVEEFGSEDPNFTTGEFTIPQNVDNLNILVQDDKSYFLVLDEPEKEITYTLILDKNYETAPRSEDRTFTTKEKTYTFSDLPALEREGYEFIGWNSDKLAKEKETDSITLTNGEPTKTVYAIWKEKEEIEQPVVPDEKPTFEQVENGKKVESYTRNDIPGGTYGSYKGIYYSVIRDTKDGGKELLIYGKFLENATQGDMNFNSFIKKYVEIDNVKYDLDLAYTNPSDPSDTKFESTNPLKLPPNAREIKLFVFSSTSPDKTIAIENSDLTPKENVANKEINVSYGKDDNNADLLTAEMPQAETIQVSGDNYEKLDIKDAPEVDNYSFEGWKVKDGTLYEKNEEAYNPVQDKITNKENIYVNKDSGNVVLEAVYEKVQEVTVPYTFNKGDISEDVDFSANNDELSFKPKSSDISYHYGNIALPNDENSYNGYKLKGWKLENPINIYSEAGDSYTLKENKAIFNPGEDIFVKYDEVKEPNTLVFEAIWEKEEQSEGKEIPVNFSKGDNAPSDVNLSKLTTSIDFTDVDDSDEYSKYQLITLPDAEYDGVKSNEGYTLAGWKTASPLKVYSFTSTNEDEGEGVYNSIGEKSDFTPGEEFYVKYDDVKNLENILFTAKWNAPGTKYTIHYMDGDNEITPEGLNSPQDSNEFEAYVPTKEGFEFMGWSKTKPEDGKTPSIDFASGSNVIVAAPETKLYALYAKVETPKKKTTYKIQFFDGSGKVEKYQADENTVESTEKSHSFGLPEVGEVEGKKFKGWATSPNSTEATYGKDVKTVTVENTSPELKLYEVFATKEGEPQEQPSVGHGGDAQNPPTGQEQGKENGGEPQQQPPVVDQGSGGKESQEQPPAGQGGDIQKPSTEQGKESEGKEPQGQPPVVDQGSGGKESQEQPPAGQGGDIQKPSTEQGKGSEEETHQNPPVVQGEEAKQHSGNQDISGSETKPGSQSANKIESGKNEDKTEVPSKSEDKDKVSQPVVTQPVANKTEGNVNIAPVAQGTNSKVESIVEIYSVPESIINNLLPADKAIVERALNTTNQNVKIYEVTVSNNDENAKHTIVVNKDDGKLISVIHIRRDNTIEVFTEKDVQINGNKVTLTITGASPVIVTTEKAKSVEAATSSEANKEIKKDGKAVPKTSDSTNAGIWFMGILASLGSIFTIKKRNK